jgi:hypothetical protein
MLCVDTITRVLLLFLIYSKDDSYFVRKLMYICENFNCKLEKLCIFFVLNYTLDVIDVPFFNLF